MGVGMEMSEDHPVNLTRSDPEYIQIGHNIGCVPVLTVFIQSPAESGIHHDIRIRCLNEERINTKSHREFFRKRILWFLLLSFLKRGRIDFGSASIFVKFEKTLT